MGGSGGGSGGSRRVLIRRHAFDGSSIVEPPEE
jgi:hypothetical protein